MVITLIKAFVEFSDRYEGFKVYDKGNVPSVKTRNFLYGNLYDFFAKPNSTKIIRDYHKKLGETFGVFYGPDPWVYTTDLDLLHFIYVKNSAGNTYSTQFKLPFTKELNLSLAAVNGDKWRTIRRTLNPSFAHKQMNSDNVYKDIEKNCHKLINFIQKHELEKNDQSQDTYRLIEVGDLSARYALEVVFQVLFGHENSADLNPNEKDPLIGAIKSFVKLLSANLTILCIAQNTVRKFVSPLFKYTQAGKFANEIHEILDQSIERRRKHKDKIDLGSRKMIDSIIESVDPNKVDDDKLKANLFFTFMAGHETAADTLTILLWLLSKHPQIQTKLRSSVLIEGSLSRYLHWCIKETLRLYPAVPVASGRVLQQDLEHKGMKFFKGTTIFASMHAIHYSKELWGDDANQFRPERFDEPLSKQHQLQFFAFSHGPRNCLGRNLAFAEIENFISRIILRYRLETCPVTPEKLNIGTQNLAHLILYDDINIKFIELKSP